MLHADAAVVGRRPPVALEVETDMSQLMKSRVGPHSQWSCDLRLQPGRQAATATEAEDPSWTVGKQILSLGKRDMWRGEWLVLCPWLVARGRCRPSAGPQHRT